MKKQEVIKILAPGTALRYEFITIAKVRLDASSRFLIDTRMRVLVNSTHNWLTASGVTRENEAAPFLYPDAYSWFSIDACAQFLIASSHSRFSVSSALRTMRAALFFVLSQIVKTPAGNG
ncbi:hypothetical protein [Acetobacter sp. P1H12_c]|uniref:hypothetical protein n=1 Tax=Acetobacter sp. P1H12_c TaxID=2762621 RepID=UPI001C0595AD|nr:hypothetical protein [Acetobacter sp. P1H12_c]